VQIRKTLPVYFSIVLQGENQGQIQPSQEEEGLPSKFHQIGRNSPTKINLNRTDPFLALDKRRGLVAVL
jgi:hypothetical protein